MKTCTVCRAEKTLAEFGKNKTKSDGLQSHCLSCGRERNKSWYAQNKEYQNEKTSKQSKARRELYVSRTRKIASSYGCQLCKECDPVVLDFHHVRDKKFHIADAVGTGVSWERIDQEIQKCVVLCANCHRRVHAGQLQIDESMTCIARSSNQVG